ncbi:hypothetical protein BC938DRAFT_481461 [Jimgerdemannia flammicorona]|uniref:C2H2-type domain-containing protein n=1 Tax=Jimgerdemannia flammicorona TaxID=994334 RepID=A0A433QG57_9FUNG|nr:hypothetical protein BC938DRAFT_481461 [Jimgerdemannia flammicorona]
MNSTSQHQLEYPQSMTESSTIPANVPTMSLHDGVNTHSQSHTAPVTPPSQATSRRPSIPAPHMMSTFSAKVVTSTPKRYKCQVCNKRFTRPSSLATHMYSHTGEVMFASCVY